MSIVMVHFNRKTFRLTNLINYATACIFSTFPWPAADNLLNQGCLIHKKT
jgi:hypothetical protein